MKSKEVADRNIVQGRTSKSVQQNISEEILNLKSYFVGTTAEINLDSRFSANSGLISTTNWCGHSTLKPTRKGRGMPKMQKRGSSSPQGGQFTTRRVT